MTQTIFYGFAQLQSDASRTTNVRTVSMLWSWSLWKASTGTEFESGLLSKRSFEYTEENRIKSKDTANQVGFLLYLLNILDY
jgi:hypothetical protein